ncbi:RxLR effector protein [Phytophthora cinnamomi]|uniref:RxLR effector protein n=2 Tax=Phytophthora cinnamomi TaxID=4785 RepID=UPI0035597F6B|nr:RxLR effector protein [Phytophthora cinnamomi]
MGRNPNKLSKKKLEKVRSYAEDNPDKWYAMSYYLDYVYGISLVTLLAGGALWYHWRPAGVGGPVSN